MELCWFTCSLAEIQHHTVRPLNMKNRDVLQFLNLEQIKSLFRPISSATVEVDKDVARFGAFAGTNEATILHIEWANGMVLNLG